MSIQTEMSIVNTRRFYLSGVIQPLTTTALMEAYACGSHIHLYSVARQRWLSGHIQGIRNESGSPMGATPKLLLVTLSAEEECVELFVRTTG